ncbi:DMP19 family protein [Sediminitomix flava]|uniref:Uncharacterized protein DUF4375 n=1 Tax=Sediminitomix flava TaxID=379075 RepID=A0A315YUP2_SEDFL|nr:DUF4375 domain-containing protein [Sediminitomix flava]PWJ33115.1 uncharacterized protein DUF4375 [Sediminitomix flava]
MTREDLQPKWEEILTKGYSDYSQLTKAERIWYNVEPLITDGLIDHYVNYGAEHNIETLEDLEFLGCTGIADLIRKFNSLFPDGIPPKDIDERNDLMGEWDDKYDSLTDQLEEDFWDKSGELEEVLLIHINRSIK